MQGCLHCLHAMLSWLYTCNVASIVYMQRCVHCLHTTFFPVNKHRLGILYGSCVINIQLCSYLHTTPGKRAVLVDYHYDMTSCLLWYTIAHLIFTRATISMLWWDSKGKNCGYRLQEQLYGLSHMELRQCWSHLASQYWFLNLQVVSSTLGESQKTIFSFVKPCVLITPTRTSSLESFL